MTPFLGRREAYNYIVDNWNIFCSFSLKVFSMFDINGINCWTIDWPNTCGVVALVKTTSGKQTPAPGLTQSSCESERECFWPPVFHLLRPPASYQPELLPPVLQVLASPLWASWHCFAVVACVRSLVCFGLSQFNPRVILVICSNCLALYLLNCTPFIGLIASEVQTCL